LLRIGLTIGQQLRYFRRNLKSIDKILDTSEGMNFPLENRDQRIYWVIQHKYDQQAQMHKEHTYCIDNRIVNVYRPYVRPIVRVKDKTQVEFEAMQGVSIQIFQCLNA
jgi:IS5 family transposase